MNALETHVNACDDCGCAVLEAIFSRPCGDSAPWTACEGMCADGKRLAAEQLAALETPGDGVVGKLPGEGE